MLIPDPVPLTHAQSVPASSRTQHVRVAVANKRHTRLFTCKFMSLLLLKW